jgi:hypothetical protein
MSRIFNATLVALLLVAAPAWGQPRGQAAAVAFGAPGAGISGGESFALLHFGGGGEFVWPSGLGVSADVGYVSAVEEFGDGVGIFSPGVFYRFGSQNNTAPFVRGGYGLLFRGGTANLFHFGGGIDHNIGPMTLRFEVRDYVYDTDYHLLEGLIGVVIGPGRSGRRRSPE